jgi:MazG family protein
LDDPRLAGIRQLLAVIDRLRAPDGCPWDRKQTEESMAAYAVEEAHEWVEAIESGEAADAEAEGGDTLLSVLMTCRIAEEAGRYDAGSAALRCAEKLVVRHPHVFGDARADTEAEVLATWEERKRAEREAAGGDASALAGIPGALPALMGAARTSSKAVGAGFHWATVQGALDKVHEELAELEAVLPASVRAAAPREEVPEEAFSAADRAAVRHELGDVLLAAAYLGVYLGLDPEALCRTANRRFQTRFRAMEAALGGGLQGRSLEELLRAWGAAKAAERGATTESRALEP